MYFDPRSVLNGEARIRKLLAIRQALDEGTYYVDNGELADALLLKAVLKGVDADAEEIAGNAGGNLPADLWN